MDQHKLYRTIRILSDEKFRTEEQLLGHILESVIVNEATRIRGGRIWKLEPASGSYRLLRQYGEVEEIQKNFRIRVVDYPMFCQLDKKGTIVANESNRYLRQKGITHYSATGVGEKIPWRSYNLYQYVLAINADYLKEDMLYTLNILGSALTSALRNRRSESKAKQLERDLDMAREIQRSILPVHELKFALYDLYGISLSERIVGGDFFDYLQASDDKDRLGVVIGDAASKGLSAAAQALYVSGAIRMGVEFQTKMSTLIGRLNRLVNKTFTPEHFISMVYAEFTDSDNGLVSYVNAGHCFPIILHAATGQTELLGATGQIIGPFPSEKYRTEFTVMRRGDIMVLYTDGIVEASNDKGEMYGEDRLIARVKDLRSQTPKEMCQLIVEDVQKHNKLIEYSDDKTIVVIRRTR
ncbi:MAG TPA: PP2C family protein-serine/threonine phosphatase [Bacteroidota bacterium]|nr:PP2C family protein-serine/threonine phosphatase [Bacteroidota bacterium]